MWFCSRVLFCFKVIFFLEVEKEEAIRCRIYIAKKAKNVISENSDKLKER
ncbi:hypothetical protein PACTADRAFT_48845 [Pachysolen tannophilus NRRL Y-2460]|uniref:Uncharacterized protein n=1 Tax=Pachysolen tannophilus NRRL Y-2460 TaxID=669874 RepID=A0A1E4TZB5_PACTA|nr:hypothetical protein PACTADRAFT_48845 [Pachysolen tannophilus NRRL Y-2460]